MLFRKSIPRACQYCTHGATLDENQMLCAKRGVVAPDASCRKFRYDPCKRVPPKPKALNFDKYRDEDFSL